MIIIVILVIWAVLFLGLSIADSDIDKTEIPRHRYIVAGIVLIIFTAIYLQA